VGDTKPRNHHFTRTFVLLGELNRLRLVSLEDGRVRSAAALHEGAYPSFRTRSLALAMSDDRRDDLFGEGVEEVGGVEGAAVNDESDVLGNVALGVELTDCSNKPVSNR
jgi:hypothetical protein